MNNYNLNWRSAVVLCAALLMLFAAVDLQAATAWSEEVTVLTPADSVSPAAPTGLVATGGNQKIDLDWADNTEDDIASYTVYRATSSGGSYASIGTPTASQFEDLTVSWDVTYYYVVTATDLSGNPESAASNEDDAMAYCSADPQKIDDSDGSVVYTGTWGVQNWAGRYSTTLHESSTAGATMEFTFMGDSIALHGENSDYGGDGQIYIDDALQTTINFLGSQTPYDRELYAASGLANGSHTIRLQVVGNGWCYVDSLIYTAPCGETPCPDKAPQSAPASVNAVAVSHTQINLSWVDNTDSEATGNCDKAANFVIERKTTGAFEEIEEVGDVTSYQDLTCLDASTTYTYRVIGRNSYGDSVPSAEAAATTEATPDPAAPSNLVCDDSAAGRNTLTWDHIPDASCSPLPPVLYYMVYRSTTQGGPYTPVAIAFGGTNITDSNVNNDVTYYYVLKAVDNMAHISGDSAEVNGTPHIPNPPAAPSDLVATAAGSTQIDLTWTDNSDNEDGFKVLRDSVEVDTTTAASYSDTGLAPSTTYSYQVVAYNADGDSAPSNSDSATTDALPPPDAPSDLVATAVSGSQIDLTWTDNSINEDEFKIYRDSVEVGTSTSASYSDTGLSPLTTYCYRVSASNAGGESAQSNEDCATTTGGSIIEDWVDDADASITYTGTWGAQTGWGGRYLTTIHESNDGGTPAAAEMTFTGVEISLIGDMQPWGGTIDVYIDTVLELEDASFNSATPDQYQQEIFKITGLSSGSHTVKIEKSGGDWIYVDAFVVGHY